MVDWEKNAKDLARVRDTLYARIDDLTEMLAKAQSERDALQAKVDEAMAIELYKQGTVDDEDERLWNAGFNVARGEFRKVLEGKE